jgi:hypothetical protein
VRGSVGDIVSVIPPSFPGVEFTSVPSPLNCGLDGLVPQRQAWNGIMWDPLVEHFGFRVNHRGDSTTTGRTRVTTIHGVNFSLDTVSGSISSAVLLVSEYPGSLDGLVGVVERHGSGSRSFERSSSSRADRGLAEAGDEGRHFGRMREGPLGRKTD